MPNCESNRNGWKDGKSKCNCCDKKEDPCCCESKDSHCENDKHEHDCHKKEHEHDCHKKDDCGCESKHDQCKDHKKDDCDCESKHNNHEKDDCGCESKHNQCKDDEHEHDKHEHDSNKKETCCCKDSMKKALELLSCPKVNPHVDFNEFGFIGKNFLVGTELENNVSGNNDNITSPNAMFNGFESCSCGLIRLSPTDDVFYPIPNSPSIGLTINHASLCNIEAIAFNFDGPRAAFEANLISLLDCSHKKCFVKCDECCCNDSIFNSIHSSFSSNIVSLTAGWLAVRDVKVLGRIGNVLVLSSTTTNRIYFVCLDSVGFLNF